MEAIRRWKRRHWMQQIDFCGMDGGRVAADAIDAKALEVMSMGMFE